MNKAGPVQGNAGLLWNRAEHQPTKVEVYPSRTSAPVQSCARQPWTHSPAPTLELSAWHRPSCATRPGWCQSAQFCWGDTQHSSSFPERLAAPSPGLRNFRVTPGCFPRGWAQILWKRSCDLTSISNTPLLSFCRAKL